MDEQKSGKSPLIHNSMDTKAGTRSTRSANDTLNRESPEHTEQERFGDVTYRFAQFP